MSILIYPDDRLRATCNNLSLDEINTKDFNKRVSKMFSLMYTYDGIGLAAPQVGWNVKLFIMNIHGRPNHSKRSVIFINPIIQPHGVIKSDIEGCLSFPTIFCSVERCNEVYTARLFHDGKIIYENYKKLAARVIQHEFDHINSTLLIDKLDKDRKEEIINQFTHKE